MKNMKKYSIIAVMKIACDNKIVWENWPLNKLKKLTVSDMMKIGVKNNLPFWDLHVVGASLDSNFCQSGAGLSTEECVNGYLEE